MGMFDYVNVALPCRKCGRLIASDWQSKSGDCAMEHLEVEQVSHFYSLCPDCGAWNEYERVLRPCPKGQTPADYVREHFSPVDEASR